MTTPTTPTPVRPWPGALQKGSHESPADGLCVLEAVAWVHGWPHSDAPSCVPDVDAAYLRGMNDSIRWASDQARAEALIPLARRAMRTQGDRQAWVRALQVEVTRRVLPLALRRAAVGHPDVEHAEELRAAADRCERVGDDDADDTADTLDAVAADVARVADAARDAAVVARDAALDGAGDAAARDADVARAVRSQRSALAASHAADVARAVAADADADAAYAAVRVAYAAVAAAESVGAIALVAAVDAGHAAYDADAS